MKTFTNEITMRQTPHRDGYLVHRRLDYMVQEQLGFKFQYHYYYKPVPGAPRTTIAVLRSGLPLGLPGENVASHDFTEGQDVRLKVWFFGGEPYIDEKGRSRQRTASEASLSEEIIPYRFNLHGLSVIHSSILEKKHIFIRRNKQSEFILPGYELSVAGTIDNRQAFETAFAHGVGHKRIFGMGMIRDLEII